MSKFVYFDLGNVLVDFDHQIAVNQLAELAGQPADQVRAVVFDSELQNQYETGLVTSSDYAAAINRDLGTSLPENKILEAASAIFTPSRTITPVLEGLRERGVPMAVLSNTCEAHWQWITNQQWSLPGDWFGFHVLSYEVRSMKPNAGIYAESERLAGVDPKNIFFTDDREENCAAAEERGWTTYLYGSADRLQNVLSTWLDE